MYTENKIIINWFIQQEHLPLQQARRLARIYDEWALKNHGKFNEYDIPKCLNKMIWIAYCPDCKANSLWCDDTKDLKTVWHCLECGYEKKPPNPEPNSSDKNIPVQPIVPNGSVK
jgi:Zn ribbon nucleic-acid-binding protein